LPSPSPAYAHRGFAVWRYTSALTLLACFLLGCADRPRQTVTQPAEPTTTTPTVAVQPPQPEPLKPPPTPKRPQPTWAILRDAFNDKTDPTLSAKWTGADRFEIKTDNVQRLTLDLHKPPEGAPQRGPWNLQIDGQGIEITGRKGKVMDLVRSRNGDWTVDPDSHRDRP
jgi:hypothetical protein